MARLKDTFMLLKKVELVELQSWSQRDWEQYWIEPKRDGVRFLRKNGKWFSSGGKKYFNVEHITKKIDAIPSINNYLIDGELYDHDWESTLSAARTENSSLENNLRYMVFDCVPLNKKGQTVSSLGLEERREMLGKLFEQVDSNFISLSQVSHVASMYEFNLVYQSHLAGGCDGVALKLRDSVYETMLRRSSSWLKVKPSKEMDCKIVDFKKGQGKYEGTLGSIGVVIPIPNFGWSTNATYVSGMSDKDRAYIWKNRQKFLGKLVEVTYRRLSAFDRLVEPRYFRMRLDKEVSF